MYGLLRDHPAVLVILGVAAFALAVYAAVALPRRRVATIARIVLVLYAGVLIVVTLNPQNVPPGFDPILNLTPGQTFGNAANDVDSSRNQLAGNIMMFMPLGVLGPLAFGLTLRGIAALSLVASLLIETGQYVLNTGRAADVDDVIANVIGAVVAAALFLFAVRRLSKTAAPEAAEAGQTGS